MINIRVVCESDRDEWARMRNSLWPDSRSKHLEAIDKYFADEGWGIVEVLVLERSPGKLAGFIELNLREYAEGSALLPVPYVEGWYVDRDMRGQGYGKQLMVAAEKWALENNFDELASDAAINNTRSIAAHSALGFKEVDRIVCFLKKIR